MQNIAKFWDKLLYSLAEYNSGFPTITINNDYEYGINKHSPMDPVFIIQKCLKVISPS